MTANLPVTDDLIYDVGMHKGEDSAYYLALGYRVVGIEANPSLASDCRERFSTAIDLGRLTVIEGAITDSDASTVKFYVHPLSVWGTTYRSWVARNEAIAPSEEIEVATIRFADVLREHGMPHFLKIDIEGGDRVCLRELFDFRDRPRYVSIEAEQRDWAGLEHEFDTLTRLGCEQFAIVQQATIPGRSITTRGLNGKPVRYQFEADASGPFGDDVGPWLDRNTALARYRRVFVEQRLFGPGSLVRRTKLGRGLRSRAERLLDYPLPGWYDTHAVFRG